MIAVARSGPVGNPPLVARMPTVRSCGVPMHEEQKRLMSILVTCPVPSGVNVCPPQVVAVMPPPEVEMIVFCGSPPESAAEPGCVVRSMPEGVPCWKSDCVVSTIQALVGALLSEKFCVVVLPSVMMTGAADAGMKPGLLALTDGYVLAGMDSE